MDLVIWSGVLLQGYIAYYYPVTILHDMTNVAYVSNQVKFLFVFQVFISLMLIFFTFLWSYFYIVHSQKKILWLFIVLVICHIRFLFSNIFIQYRPVKYLRQYWSFIIAVLLLLVIYFYNINVSYYWGIPLIITILFKVSIHKVLPFFIILLIADFYNRRFDISQKIAIISLVFSFICIIIQVLVYSHIRKILYQPIIIQKVNFSKYMNYLMMLNIIQECYLLQSAPHEISRKRPIITPTFIKYFRSGLHTLNDFYNDSHNLLLDAFQSLSINVKSIKSIYDRGTILGCIIFYNDNSACIVIRGTSNLTQWIGNIAGATHVYSPTDKGYKHVQINQTVHRIMKQVIESIDPSINNLVLVGHSRGSTISLYLSFQLTRLLPMCNIKLYLFAPPPLIDPRLKPPRNVQVETIFHPEDILYEGHKLVPIGTSSVGKLLILPSQQSQKMNLIKKINYLIKKKKKKLIVHELFDYMKSLENN